MGTRKGRAGWLCVLVLLGALAGGACVALDDADVAYVDEAIVAIVGSWDCRELAGRASPEMESEWTPEQMVAPCRVGAAMLGSLRSYKGSYSTARATLDSDGGRVVLGSYIAAADFEKGSAIIEVITIRRDGLWQIRGFTVTPESHREPVQPRGRAAQSIMARSDGVGGS